MKIKQIKFNVKWHSQISNQTFSNHHLLINQVKVTAYELTVNITLCVPTICGDTQGACRVPIISISILLYALK